MIPHTMFSTKKNDHETKVFRNTESNDDSHVHSTIENALTTSSSNDSMLKHIFSIAQEGIKYWGIIGFTILVPIVYLIHVNLHTDKITKLTTAVTENTINTKNMTEAIIAIILTGLGIIFNPIIAKKYDRLTKKFDESNELNAKQHTEIIATLKLHGMQFSKFTATKDVKIILTKILSDALVYSEQRELSEWISSEGKDFINFCNNLLSIGFNNTTPASFKADISVMITTSNSVTKQYFGEDFLKIVKVTNATRYCSFQKDVLVIISDTIMNSKVDRFRATSEIFLQQYLSSTITSYIKYKAETDAKS